MNASELYRQTVSRGYRLETDGRDLLVFGSRNDTLPTELVAGLRQHKSELLAMLEPKSDNLTPDRAPWLYIARQVLAGEFDGADRSTVESLVIGLRNIAHPHCQHALARLRNKRASSTPP